MTLYLRPFFRTSQVYSKMTIKTTEQLSLELLFMIEKHRKNRHMSTYPIVGMFYRPPAQAIISVLPIGLPLTLIAEPDNPADTNAVAVWVNSSDIPEKAHERLSQELTVFGYSLEQVLAQESWQLGYVPKEMARQLREADTVPVDEPIEGSFSLSSRGAPRVRLSDG